MENSKEPALEIDMNGEKFIATRDNTTLFQFFGHLAIYDHVFIEMGMEESTPIGAYLFKTQEVWDELVDFMVTNEFPQHVALRDVGQCDVDAFERTMFTDVRHNATFPPEWATNGTA